jgi:predicted DNA binding CopG/RHH family protein
MAGRLTKEEQAILDSYERGEWLPGSSKTEIEKYSAAAARTIKKDKRVNIRISGRDLELLQERALVEGLPYQTLMSSVLHKYVNGTLVDKSNKA